MMLIQHSDAAKVGYRNMQKGPGVNVTLKSRLSSCFMAAAYHSSRFRVTRVNRQPEWFNKNIYCRFVQ